MHGENFLHRDIAPDNIIVRADGTPVLLDFGAARRAVAEMSRTMTGIVKAGYSPHEQYSSDSRLQGPWSDLYALGGALYRAVTGQAPEEATLRVDQDHVLPAAKAAKGTLPAGFPVGHRRLPQGSPLRAASVRGAAAAHDARRGGAIEKRTGALQAAQRPGRSAANQEARQLRAARSRDGRSPSPPRSSPCWAVPTAGSSTCAGNPPAPALQTPRSSERPNPKRAARRWRRPRSGRPKSMQSGVARTRRRCPPSARPASTRSGSGRRRRRGRPAPSR